MRSVAEKDGIHFDLSRKVVADSRSAAGDVNIVTHAHMDHAPTSAKDNVVCSELTGELVQERSGITFDHTDGHKHVELLPSGHILGSSAALIEDGDRKFLYTGDVSTRDRCYMQGFQPVDADVLIIESTYGVPAYTFPEQEELEAQITDWLQDNAGNPLFLFGYALGRAQKIQHLVQEATDRDIVVHDKIHAMNQVIQKHTDVTFRSVPYADNNDLVKNEDTVTVLPSGLADKQWVQDLQTKIGARTAGFTGWAATGRFGSNRYDAAFPLSDHCDFEELMDLVTAVDPEKVYTHHGFDEAFAAFLRDEHGYWAQPLKSTQASLMDY